MNYLIDKKIVFQPETRTLHSVGELEISITLSNQATRLLIELLKGNKTPQTKETLLKNVWEDYGLTPSNNNLYMAVSEIRKSFVSLGIEDMIISTIPKMGFLFSASIDVLEEGSKENNKKQVKKSKQKKTHIMVTVMVITIIITSLFYFYKKQKNFGKTIKTLKTTSATMQDKCTFYSLNKNSELYLPMVIGVLSKNKKLECSNHQKSVFYKIEGMKYIFTATCNGDKNKLSDCESYRVSTGV